MQKPLLVSVISVACLVGCSSGGSEQATEKAAAPAAATTAAPKEIGHLVKAGFGQEREYAWASAIVHNNTDQVGQTVTVNFNVLDAAGEILASQSQVEAFSQPKADHILGTQVEIPKGGKAAKVEATVDVSADGTFSDKPFAMETTKPTFAKDEFGSGQVTFTLSNPYSSPIKSPRIGVACFDSAGKIIGGGSDFPELAPANGRVKVSVRTMVTGTPAACDAHVGNPLDGDIPEGATSASATPDGEASSAASTVGGQPADQFFKGWIGQFGSRDWKGQYASLVNAQKDAISEKAFLACRADSTEKITWKRTLSVTDGGVTKIPGTSASLPSTKVVAELEMGGVKVPLDVHLVTEDGQWKWMLDDNGFAECKG